MSEFDPGSIPDIEARVRAMMERLGATACADCPVVKMYMTAMASFEADTIRQITTGADEAQAIAVLEAYISNVGRQVLRRVCCCPLGPNIVSIPDGEQLREFVYCMSEVDGADPSSRN